MQKISLGLLQFIVLFCLYSTSSAEEYSYRFSISAMNDTDSTNNQLSYYSFSHHTIDKDIAQADLYIDNLNLTHTTNNSEEINEIYKLTRFGILGMTKSVKGINPVIGVDLGYQRATDNSLELTADLEKSIGIGFTLGANIVSNNFSFQLSSNIRTKYFSQNWSANNLIIFVTKLQIDYELFNTLTFGINNTSLLLVNDLTESNENHDRLMYYLRLSLDL